MKTKGERTSGIRVLDPSETDAIGEARQGRAMRLAIEGGVAGAAAPAQARPLDYVAPRVGMQPRRRAILVRAAEKQDLIDALEHGAMAARFGAAR